MLLSLLLLLLLLPLLLVSYLSDKIRCSYAPYKTISLRYRFHESDDTFPSLHPVWQPRLRRDHLRRRRAPGPGRLLLRGHQHQGLLLCRVGRVRSAGAGQYTGGTKCSQNCSRGFKTNFASFLNVFGQFIFFARKRCIFSTLSPPRPLWQGLLSLTGAAYPIAPVERIKHPPNSMVSEDRYLFQSWQIFAFLDYLAPPVADKHWQCIQGVCGKGEGHERFAI